MSKVNSILILRVRKKQIDINFQKKGECSQGFNSKSVEGSAKCGVIVGGSLWGIFCIPQRFLKEYYRRYRVKASLIE